MKRIVQVMSCALALSLLLGTDICAQSKPFKEHSPQSNKGGKSWKADDDAVRVNQWRDLLYGHRVGNVVLTEKELNDIHRANTFDIPPGIRKNLARGKPLPPGIRKQLSVLPTRSNSVFGVRYPNARVGILDDDVIIFNPRNNIIIDILRDVLD